MGNPGHVRVRDIRAVPSGGSSHSSWGFLFRPLPLGSQNSRRGAWSHLGSVLCARNSKRAL